MRVRQFGVVGLVAVAVAGCSSGGTSGSAASPSQSSSAALPAGVPSLAPVAAGAKFTLNTDQGPIVIALDPKAPVTDASIAYLANKGYYNNTTCHRLTTSGLHVLQCGDPTGTGRGGPGYTIPDENLPTKTNNDYPRGTVAMANSGPDTNGSQFFIVYQDTTLNPNYTVFGTVVSGMEAVDKVAAAGVVGGATDGKPALPLTIQTATVQ